MNLKNLKIRTQLKYGFALLLSFVLILGIVSYLNSTKMQGQTETLYSHPLQVREALGEFKSDVLGMQVGMKDLFLPNGQMDLDQHLSQIDVYRVDALKQITVFYSQYLGPRKDVEILERNFLLWNLMRNETIRLVREGKMNEAATRTSSSGVVGKHIEVLLKSLDRIDVFARNKADTLFASSVEIGEKSNMQLLFLIGLILLLSLLIYNFILKSVRNPLDEMRSATQRFYDGDMSARSSYALKNEFGELSDAINAMVAKIQSKNKIDERIESISFAMLQEYDMKQFYKTTLKELAESTWSQMAAVYLLNSDKQSFEHFESIGLGDKAKQSFSASGLEGEFGAVLASRKLQKIRKIQQDTRFVFHTVSGEFSPCEIVSIPIISENEIVAIISLSSINVYSQESIDLINRVMFTLNARVDSILAYHKMSEFSNQLSMQNSELETQKAELEMQSAKLGEQNIELEMQKQELSQASQLKTNFLSNMSHELRTPLNSVIALSGVLNRRLANKIPADEYSYLEVIERNGKNLLNLINDILDISRIEAGREEVEVSVFNPSDQVQELVTMLYQQAVQKNIKLLNLTSDLTVSLKSDATKFRHIMQNLISNAVKFTEHGSVEIQVKQIKDRVEFSVVDTGVGISEEHIFHIFEEFRQADSSTSRRFGGTGLGLAIARKYAQLLGGTITVTSKIGEGSTFTLSLPLVFVQESNLPDAVIVEQFNQSIDLKPDKIERVALGKNILLIEDSESAIIQMKDILEADGYTILVARDGAEGLAILSESIPDAIILDLMMPGVDGFEVLKTMRNADETAHVPVLILSAKHLTSEDLTFLKRNNVHELIQKGDVNRIHLLEAVAKITNTQKEVIAPKKRAILPIEGKPVVLIVEDNPDNMITIKAVLEDGYTILEAVNGMEGIEMAEKHKPHLILMDIALPQLDGITAFKTIRNNPKLQHIPVIAVTASAMNSERETILAQGLDGYISKPIDVIDFFETINEVLYGK